MKLTLRQTEIIKIILDSTINVPCNMQFISTKLNISHRTVSRELSAIEDWFKENNLLLVKKAGVGIYWDQNHITKEEVINLLQNALASKEYSKEERKRYIIKEIINSKQPIKSSYFIMKLGISSKTFKMDMDEVTKWLHYYGVSVINKSAIGIAVVENEINIRKAIIGLIHEIYGDELLINFLNGDFILSSIKGNTSNVSNIKMLEFINLKTLNIVKEIMTPIKNNIHCNDGSYMNILMYLVVLSYRMQNNCFIAIQNNEYVNNDITKYITLAKKIIIYLEEQFKCNMIENEIIYLANYLATLDLNFEHEFNIKISQNVKELISIVQNKIGIKFEADICLLNDLIKHLKFTIPILEKKISIQNFQIDFLKENYIEIFEATKEGLNIILKRYNIDEVPEEEIAFITMHFANSAERMFDNCKIRIVIICPSGIGTARMLKTSLMKAFSFFEIVNTLSIVDINTNQLKQDNIQLIVSTMKLDLDFPNIKVNPILSAQDKVDLKFIVKDLVTFTNEDLIAKNQIKEPTASYNTSYLNIREITQYGLEIINIIDSVFLYKSNVMSSKYEMIQKVATLVGKTPKDIIEISEKLVARERITSTYISQFNVYLFHCKTSGIDNLKFGFVKLIRPFSNSSGDVVKGAIALLVPQSTNTMYTNISSAISENLAENAIMEKIMQAKNKFEISNIIENILLKMFINYINETGE
ncbi:hypothetical protein AN396_06270 [Candidatus Epulonipiscium fishelsonii]|uniref:Uncharacterized protein n=1 Tax=Candidatus Epulonipiscium fishelsonii TaxID=77094 RepID=A0ACC8XCN0_9FIRM|nr:hypothetical protein AN396_06270 [Epulopiscium sp. SCG-B11WGA-EpuloA1]